MVAAGDWARGIAGSSAAAASMISGASHMVACRLVIVAMLDSAALMLAPARPGAASTIAGRARQSRLRL
jgi:hypothetical protein